jgi:hypothetical protein
MDAKTARIRALNDELRQNFAAGIAVMTPGVAALGADQSHAQISLPTAKITTHAMRSRKTETARSLCFLNSLNPSLTRVGRRKTIERTKRKIGIAAATKAIILKIIVHSFSVPLPCLPPQRAALASYHFLSLQAISGGAYVRR